MLAAVGVIFVLVGASMVLGSIAGLGRGQEAAISVPQIPTAAVTPSPSPSSSPSATPSPSPTAVVDPLAPAMAALSQVQAAIEAAKGGSGLKGKEVNDLHRMADRVGQDLASGELELARNDADKLEERIRSLIGDRNLQGSAAERLLAAVTALRNAIPLGG